MKTFAPLAGRITWTAQERQGSKEWMTRRTSTGSSAFSTGVLTRACSIGPGVPLVSLGDAFQQVGVMTMYRDIFPLEMFNQCPRAPRGASVSP